MKKQQKAYAFALLSVFFWSTVATAFKIALRTIGFMELIVFTSLVSSIAIFIILLFTGRHRFFLHLGLRDLTYYLLLGFLNPFLYYIILFRAYSILPAQEAMTLNYTWPVMLVILSVPLLKQKITITSLLCILVSFAGIIVISSKGSFSGLHFSNFRGDMLATGSSVVWALFWILNVKDQRDETEKLFLSFFFGFIFSLIAAFIFTGIKIPYGQGLTACIYIGLFEMGITFIFWLKALKYSLTTDKVSQLVFISPFLSLIFIHYIIGEEILLSTIAGIILIITGIILQQSLSKMN